MQYFLFDPDPEVKPGGGNGPTEKTGGGNELSQEQLDQVAGHVRGVLGLKDGQDIPAMITGATKRSVSDALGIEKGQTATDFFTNIVKGALADKPEPEKKTTKTTEQADEFKAELSGMKETLSALQSEKEQATREAVNERRKGVIRDALGQFDLRDSTKAVIVKAFVQGYEGPTSEFNEAGDLVVQSENGHAQPFGDYLKDYFNKTENRGLLSDPKFNGSGARKTGGATMTPFDTSTVNDREKSTFHDAYKEDPEGTIEAMNKANEEKAQSIYL